MGFVEDAVDGEVMPSAGNVSWRQGRHLLRQWVLYFQSITPVLL